MFGSSMLDIALGIVFIFLLMSVLATAVNEIILSSLNLRGKYLLRGIATLLSEDGKGNALKLVSQVYNHGQVCGLYAGDFDTTRKRDLPAYIPSRNFALAIMGVLEESGTALSSAAATAMVPSLAPSSAPSVAPSLVPSAAPVQVAAPAAAVAPAASIAGITQAMQSAAAELVKTAPKVGRPLVAMMTMAGNDCTRFQQAIEDWYNSGMDRVSGWYKYRTQWCLFFIGLVMAVTLNANTIGIVRQISRDSTLRQALVAAAQSAKAPATGANVDLATQVKIASTSFNHVTELGIPLGWPHGLAPHEVPEAILGWLLTAIAVSLGAPFWFDILNKIMVVRSTVKPSEKSQDEGSKD